MTVRMFGLTLTSETMLCLGIMFILSGVLYFYMKKQIGHLENSQMEQARVLQNVITMITNKPAMPEMAGGTNNSTLDVSDSENLIDVSDGEESNGDDSDCDSGSDSECDSDDEDESDNDADSDDEEESNHPELGNNKPNDLMEFRAMPIQESSLNDIDEESVVEIMNNVKVININRNESTLEPEEVELELNSLTSTNIDDDDDDTLTVNSSMSGSNLAKTSLKTLKVGDLRKMVMERGLHNDPSKVKKNELIELLQQ